MIKMNNQNDLLKVERPKISLYKWVIYNFGPQHLKKMFFFSNEETRLH